MWNSSIETTRILFCVVKSFIVILYTMDWYCNICKIEVDIYDKIVTCINIHIFCADCLDKWHKINKTCPVCRVSTNQIVKQQGLQRIVENFTNKCPYYKFCNRHLTKKHTKMCKIGINVLKNKIILYIIENIYSDTIQNVFKILKQKLNLQFQWEHEFFHYYEIYCVDKIYEMIKSGKFKMNEYYKFLNKEKSKYFV